MNKEMILKAAELIKNYPNLEVKLFVSDEISEYRYTSHEIYSVEISDYYDGGEYGERIETDVEDLANELYDRDGGEGLSYKSYLRKAKLLMRNVILIKTGV